VGSTPFRFQAAFGFALIIAGFVFDFAFVTTPGNFAQSLQNQPASYVWTQYAYELTKFYLFVLGFSNLAQALLIPRLPVNEELVWTIFGLMAGGSTLFIAGGLWEARIGPVYRMEPPCYVLGAGLFAILASLALEIYALVRSGGGESTSSGRRPALNSVR